jgi:type II secretory pathway pseudopilin PulG
MSQGERGFALLEIILAVALSTITFASALMVTIYVLKNNEQTNQHMTAVAHAESAAYWIARDTQMADGITTDNSTPEGILVLSWTDWGYGSDSIYHVVTYSIEDTFGEVGKLKRTHQDSDGNSDQATIAEHIYYNPSDVDNTTKVSYEDPVLSLKVATLFGQAEDAKEYEIYRLPNFQ